MDPRVSLHVWAADNDNSYEAGRTYNDWTARGGFPVVIELKDDRFATVISVSGKAVKVVFNATGKKGTVKRANINRVTLI